jgi:hypothetical protein
MTRPRGNAQRIAAAHRAGTRARLVSAGVPDDRVDALLQAFDALPDREGERWDGEAAFRWAMSQPRPG